MYQVKNPNQIIFNILKIHWREGRRKRGGEEGGGRERGERMIVCICIYLRYFRSQPRGLHLVQLECSRAKLSQSGFGHKLEPAVGTVCVWSRERACSPCVEFIAPSASWGWHQHRRRKIIPVPTVCTGALSRHSPPDGCMCHSDCRKWKFKQTASTLQLGVAVFNHEDKAQSPGNGI